MLAGAAGAVRVAVGTSWALRVRGVQLASAPEGQQRQGVDQQGIVQQLEVDVVELVDVVRQSLSRLKRT